MEPSSQEQIPVIPERKSGNPVTIASDNFLETAENAIISNGVKVSITSSAFADEGKSTNSQLRAFTELDTTL